MPRTRRHHDRLLPGLRVQPGPGDSESRSAESAGGRPVSGDRLARGRRRRPAALDGPGTPGRASEADTGGCARMTVTVSDSDVDELESGRRRCGPKNCLIQANFKLQFNVTSR
jgi:hypothetical protein